MTSCSQDMAMDGCQDCNATACATPDPLREYGASPVGQGWWYGTG